MSASHDHDHDWRRRAACIGADGSLFFPEPHEPGYRERLADARSICAGCPVAKPCRRWAIDHPFERGVWGGLTEKQRRSIRQAGRDGGTAA